MTLGQSTTIQSFFSNGAFTLNSATLSGSLANAAGTLTVNNVFSLNGGGITNFTINQGTGGSVVVGSAAFGSDIVNANLDMTTHADAFLAVSGNTVENGAITLGTTSNGIQLRDNGTIFTLGTMGSLTGFGSVSQYYSNTLTNAGTINANNSAHALNLGVTAFNNSGTAKATNGGTLNLNSVTTNTGTLAAKSGGIVNLNGTFTVGVGSILDGVGGTFNVNGIGLSLLGNLNSTAGTSLVFNNSGNNSLSATSPVAVNTNLDLTTHADAFLAVNGSVTENQAISLGTTSNGIQLHDNGTTLTLGSAGSLTGFGTMSQYYQNTLTNAGTINANSSANSLNLNVAAFNNSGTSEATNGATLNIIGATGTNNGTLTATGGSATLNLTNDTITNNGTVSASHGNIANISGALTMGAGGTLDGTLGTFNINGTALTLLGNLNTTTGTTLVFSGSNSITGQASPSGVNANLDLTTHADALLDINGAVTQNQAINLGTTTGGLRVHDNGTTFTLGSTGSLTGFGTVSQYYQNALTNAGTINANSAGKTLNINTSAFTNTGTTEVQNGATLSVTGAITDSGNLLVHTGGTTTLTQNLTQTGGLTQVDGTLNSSLTLSAGTLAGTGTLNGNVANTGGMVSAGDPASAPGTVTITGTLSQGPGGTMAAQFDNSKNSLLAIAGAVTTGGVLDVSYLGTTPYTGTGLFTFLNYGSLTSSITGTAQPQYFSNETFDAEGNGIIDGSNGFIYRLLNNTDIKGLQLGVLTKGDPMASAAPEPSALAVWALVSLGGGGLVLAARRKKASAAI